MLIKKTKDVYEWCVVYQDGTALHEYDHPDGYDWKDIGDKPIKEVWLLHPDLTNYGHHVAIPEGTTPICFRRRYITINLNGEDAQPHKTVHCIGWKRDEQACYLFVFENGSTLMTNDLQAI